MNMPLEEPTTAENVAAEPQQDTASASNESPAPSEGADQAAPASGDWEQGGPEGAPASSVPSPGHTTGATNQSAPLPPGDRAAAAKAHAFLTHLRDVAERAIKDIERWVPPEMLAAAKTEAQAVIREIL